MILTFAEDFTSTVQLDSQLVGVSDSGLYWNRGVHSLLTVENLLEMLPAVAFTFEAYAAGTTYSKFDTSRSKSDIVLESGKIYQSLSDSNIGNQPSTSPSKWLETNIESLRVKSFIWSVEDNFTSALSLNRKLIENQYVYNVNSNASFQTLSNDYSGWAFEPKGSDYVKIRINQMSLQANTTNPVVVTIVNQGQVIDTITLNPNNGILSFEDVDKTIYGKGRFLFVFESQEVLGINAYNDPLRYEGFVCHPVNGIGSTPEGSDYSQTSNSNGLNFNVSVYLDSGIYLTNNKIDFAKFLQSQMEVDYLNMLKHNSNSTSSRIERIIGSSPQAQALLATETLELSMNTVARKYEKQKKMAIESINKTFDKFLHSPKGFRVKRKVS
jgi:hypothetical protein